MTLPTAVVHRPYTPEPLRFTGGGECSQNEVSVRVVFGRLPDGVTLSAAGEFSGTPSQIGTYTFLLRAANACRQATRALTLRVDGAPLLVITPDSLTFHCRAGEAPPAQTIRVASNWQDMAYSTNMENTPWLKLSPLRGRTPVHGSGFVADVVSVSIQPEKLAPGTYHSRIKLTTWQVLNEPVIPVTLVVEP